MSDNDASKESLLLDRVALLTAIRDLDVFEFSFIKSLANLLKTDVISLYKINNADQSCNLIRYTSSDRAFDLKHIPTEIYTEDDVPVPDKINKAIVWIGLTDKIYSEKQDNEYLIVYPVADLNNTTGYITMQRPHPLSDNEKLVIISLLSISHNFHSLLEESQKDKLTGLLNRKTFDDNIYKIQNLLKTIDKEEYTGIEKRKNTNNNEFWLAIIDIDFFKRINDTFGHIYGDEVLLLLSQLMKKAFRSNDLLFRFGGEEFIAIIKAEDKQKAKRAFERFRVAIEEFSFPQIGQVTISLGATLIMDHYVVPSDIVGRADKALYHAKNNGRNKLYIYEELVSEGILEEKNDNDDLEFF
jgi:diguanylate cyclase (GGDEF)-like protein